MAKNPYTFRYKDNSSLVLRLLGTASTVAMDEVGETIAREANQRAPVGDTAQLSKSYTHRMSNDGAERTVEIGSTLDYAPYVELGTGPHYTKPPGWVDNFAKRGHHTADPWWYIGKDGEWHMGWFVHPRPHLRPAVTENLSKIRDIIKKHLKKA